MNVFWTKDKIKELTRRSEACETDEHIALVLGSTASAVRAARKRHIYGRPDEIAEKAANAEKTALKAKLDVAAQLGTTDAELLTQIGRLLFGDTWQAATCRLLHINKDTMQSYLRDTYRPKPGIYKDLLAAMKTRREEIAEQIERLDKIF